MLTWIPSAAGGVAWQILASFFQFSVGNDLNFLADFLFIQRASKNKISKLLGLDAIIMKDIMKGRTNMTEETKEKLG